MTLAEIIVTVAGIGAIGWINWYFFLAGRGRGGVGRERGSSYGNSDPIS